MERNTTSRYLHGGIQMPMEGGCIPLGPPGDYLGRTSGWRQQSVFVPLARKKPRQQADEECLTRASRTPQQENGAFFWVLIKLKKNIQGFLLIRGEHNALLHQKLVHDVSQRQ